MTPLRTNQPGGVAGRRQFLYYLLLCLLALVVIAGLLGAAQATAKDGPVAAPPPDAASTPAAVLTAPPELSQWIEQLGDRDYGVREAATRKIRDLGLPAKPALIQALRSNDPEVRLRARRCLAEILEADYQARLKAFEQDTQGRDRHELAGWQRFREVVGEDSKARKLFVEMHRAEAGLLESSAAGGDLAAEAVLLRCQQVLQLSRVPDPDVRRQPSLGTVAALIFVASDPAVKLPDQTQVLVFNFVNQPAFQTALRSGDQQQQVRELLGAWIQHTPSNSLAYQTLRLAMQHDIKQGLVPAARVAKQKNVSAYMRMYGVLAIGKLGDRRHVAELEPLLDDGTICSSRTTVVNGERTTYRIELRDVVVAVLAHLTEQPLEDYYLDSVRRDSATLFNTGTLGYKEQKKREEAVKKMKAWLAENAEALQAPPAEEAAPPFDPRAANETKERAAGPVAAPAPAKVAGQAPAAPPRQAAAPVQAPPVFPVLVQRPDDETDQENEDISLADRELATFLAKAQQQLENENYGNALILLDHVLGAGDEGLIRPVLDLPLYQSLRAEAERMLAELPQAAREAYELRYGVVARRALDQALQTGDLETLQNVLRRYRFTQAGAEAALIWARHLLDRDRPLQAAIVLERLQNNWAAPPLDSATTWHHALSWLRAGMVHEAKLRLTALTEGQRRDLQLAGLPVEIPDLVRRFAQHRTLSTARDDDWLLVRGDARRSGRAIAAGLPWLRARWQYATTDGEAATEALQTLRKLYREQHFATLPAGQPLAVDGRVLVRTASALLAIDAKTGNLAWQAAFDDGVATLMARDQGSLTADSPQLLTGLDERSWGDATYGTMSSDGQHVFGVEDVGFSFGLLNQRIVVGPDGSRRLDPGWPRDHNRLTAYDVATGKLVWELGGPQGQWSLPLAGMYFLGPPLPLADQLYVVGEQQGGIHLVVLDRTTGRPLAKQRLSSIDDGSQQNNNIYTGTLPRREPRRMSGASPSYSDGILVCPVAGDKFVAMDLASGEIRWTFHPEQQVSRSMRIMAGLQRNGNQAEHRERRWSDACVSLAGGRALLTPQGHDAIYCLDLQSGRLLWQAPRLDSQFLAATTDTAVVLVGRGTMRALSLTDGSEIWRPFHLPPGASPSGRGFTAAGLYYLPLDSNEVIVVDLATGTPRQRTRSLSGSEPGNLIACAGRIISQNVDRIEGFDQIDVALAALETRLKEQPQNTAAAREHAELLLFSGAHRKAFDILMAAYQQAPEPAIREQLCTTIVEGLATDFEQFAPIAKQHADLFETPSTQFAQLRALAEQHTRSDNTSAAFDTLLAMSRLEGLDEVDAAEGDLAVRRDRWLAGRMLDLYRSANQTQRTKLDATVTDHLRQATAAGLDALQRHLELFAWHATAEQTRWTILEQLGREQTFQRENHLLHLAQSSNRATAGKATALLAQMLTAVQRPEAAAVLYRRLNEQFANQVCLDGKTGRQLFAELPVNLEVSRMLRNDVLWPTGRVDITRTNERLNNFQRNYLLELDDSPAQLIGNLRLEAEQVGTNHRLMARDGFGTPRWRVRLPAGSNPRPFYGAMLRARMAGHLLVVHRGNQFFGIDTSTAEKDGENDGARVLWSTDLEVRFPGVSPTRGFAQLLEQRPGRFPRLRAYDVGSGGMAELGVVTPGVVCFHKLQTLQAVDPLTGKLLWKRFDLSPGSEVFGDDQIILVAAPQSREAMVLRTLDGREIGRCQLPDESDRIVTLGRCMLIWQQEQQGKQLTLVDPWENRVRWQHRFTQTAHFWLLGTDEVAVLDDTGRFVVASLEDGALRVDQIIQPDPNLTDMFVVLGPRQYLLFANSPQQVQGLINPVPGGYHSPLVGGTIYGFDRETGKQLWQTSIGHTSFDYTQPLESPMLVLASRVYDQNRNGRITRQFSPIVCIDKRTGRKVVEEELTGSISRVDVIPDPGNHVVEIRTNQSALKLTLTSEPWPEGEAEKPIPAPEPKDE